MFAIDLSIDKTPINTKSNAHIKKLMNGFYVAVLRLGSGCPILAFIHSCIFKEIFYNQS